MRVTLKPNVSQPQVFRDDGSEINGVLSVNMEVGYGLHPRADLTVTITEVDVTCGLAKLYGIWNGQRYRMVEV